MSASPPPSHEERLRALLEAGLDLPPGERRAALEARCDDPDLVAEAMALLEEESDTFLEIPAARALEMRALEIRASEMEAQDSRAPEGGPSLERPPGAEDAEVPPQAPPPVIPGFRVEALLGEGGMGRVYRARQTGPGERTVAVKVMRAGLLHSEMAARFPVEQQALARLNHPAIAQFYTADTTAAGQPYVVMEHVDGQPITHFCDDHRLGVEERLRLFIEVCHGVEHAHRRQLLHRDLKPSNLMVTTEDGTPRPKIIDFGIARILDAPPGGAHGEGDEDGALRTGLRVIGTPHYMSPEALYPVDGSADGAVKGERDLDTRTDVYSLGVVLHELLTGVRPKRDGDGARPGTDSRRGRWTRPIRPSDQLERMPADSRRTIETARVSEPGQLSHRLEGDLDWIVLKALAPDRRERYGSAAELAADLERSLRHEPVLARPPSFLYRLGKLARRHRVAAALVTLTVLALVAATVTTSLALVRATRAERHARAEAAAASQALDFLVDLFQAADPEERGDREIPARELVRRGSEAIDEQALPPLQRARLLHTLAQVQLNLSELAASRELAAEALALREAALPPDDPQLLDSLDLLGTVERRAGNLEAAEPLLERLLARAEADAAANPVLLGDALNSLANLRWRQGRLEEAEALHRRAFELRREIAESDPEERVEMASSQNNLGVLLWSQGKLEEAEPHLRQALAGFEAELGPEHARVVAALTNLSNILYRLERYPETEALLLRALETSERTLGPDHFRTSAVLHNLAMVEAARGRVDEAEATYRRALDVRRRVLGETHAETLRTLGNLAGLLSREGRLEEARETYGELVSLQRRADDLEPWRLPRSLYHLGDLYSQQGEIGTADRHLAEAQRLQEALDPPRPEHLADTLRSRADVAAQAGDEDRAGRLRARAEALAPAAPQ